MENLVKNELMEQIYATDISEVWKDMQETFDERSFRDFLMNIYEDECTGKLLGEAIMRILNFGWVFYNDKPDLFCKYLQCMIPGYLSFGEATMFMDDSNLTELGKEEKKVTIHNYANNSDA